MIPDPTPQAQPPRPSTRRRSRRRTHHGRPAGSVYVETTGVLIADGRGHTVRLTWHQAQQAAEDLTRVLIARERPAQAPPDVPPSLTEDGAA